MKKKNLAAVGLVVLAALFFSINLASGALLRSTRIDLTEDKLFTLSEGTRNVLRGMEEPVTLRFFYSKKLVSTSNNPRVGAYKDYAQRVLELLEEFSNVAGDQLRLYVIDPVPFSEEEDEAASYGLRGVPANLAGEPLYFGLAGTNTTDEEETIPFFRPERQQFLEYDLTQLVYKLSYANETVVGLMSTLPIEGGAFNPMNPTAQPEPGWMIVDQIRQLSEVRSVPTTATAIDEDVDVLVLVHPKGLSDATLFALDQYVLRGGKLICFLDSWCEADPIPQDPNNPLAGVSADRASSLGPLLAAWGVELVKDRIAGDKDHAMTVGFRGQPVDYVVYLQLTADAMAQDDQITAELSRLHMATPGILKPTDGATTTFQPLVWTSEDSMEVDRINVAIGPDPLRLFNEFVPSGRRLTLAARVSGKVATAFPDGDPAAAEEADAPEDDASPADDESDGADDAGGDDALKESEADVNLVLFSDVDMLQDRFWVEVMNVLGTRLASPTASNADVLVNAIDVLSGSSDLIGLRSRSNFGRPFDRVAELRREAEERFRAEEQALETELQDIERRIRELESQKDDSVSSLLLSPEQREEIERAREKRIETRKKLRDVKHSLQDEIESLGMKLKALNIFVFPFGLGLVSLLVLIARSSRRKA